MPFMDFIIKIGGYVKQEKILYHMNMKSLKFITWLKLVWHIFDKSFELLRGYISKNIKFGSIL